MHLCKSLHNAWGWTDPVLWYPLGQNLAILKKKKTYEEVWVCGILTPVSSKLLLFFKFYFWLFWDKSPFVASAGLGITILQCLLTFPLLTHFHRREWGIKSVFVAPEQPGSIFFEFCSKSVNFFRIIICIEIQNSSLLWSHHFEEWSQVIPWATSCPVSSILSQEHPLRTPFALLSVGSTYPKLVCLIPSFLSARESHLTDHKPSCHWCPNCRWLLNASCVWKKFQWN